MKINRSKIQLIEAENLFKKYEGRRHGVKYKVEYPSNSDEEVFDKVTISAVESLNNSSILDVTAKLYSVDLETPVVADFFVNNQVRGGNIDHVEFSKSLTKSVYDRVNK